MIRRKNIKKEIKIRKIIIFCIFFISISISSFYLINKLKDENERVKEDELISEIEINKSLMPIRKWEANAPSIGARSGLVAYIDSSNQKKYLFEKNKDLKVSIASITKLMTALVFLENYNQDINKTITIPQVAFNNDIVKSSEFFEKEQYKIKDFLYLLLMESNNAAAYILPKLLNEKPDSNLSSFVKLMNQKANDLGMENTFFINPSGLDNLNASNYSTAKDLILLSEAVLKKPLILEILTTLEYDLIRSDGFFKYTVVNTNLLLNEIPEIVFGKTGTTTKAGQCLILTVLKNNEDYLISIVLGSSDRFEETKKIINWANEGYYWEINEWLNNK